MSLTYISNSFSLVISNNTKVKTMENTLQQSLDNFKDLLSDFEQLHIESDNYKLQITKLKEKCDSNNCSSALALKKIIESKDNIIQLVASSLTRLNETKDFKILDDIFKIIFGESHVTIPQCQDNVKSEDIKQKTSPINIKKELHASAEDLSFKEEYMSEIEGTPTMGRVSPIIQTKKLKSSFINATDFREKKKCPDSWLTPEKKAMKVSICTPPGSKRSGKFKQSKLNLVKVKETEIIDITCSPEFNGGSRSKQEADGNVKLLIKKESIENDDTILPSPTSGPNSFTLFKSKESPLKFKKPALSLKTKSENKTPKKNNENGQPIVKIEQSSESSFITDLKINDSVTYTQEDSINLLNPNRLPKTLRKPIKAERNNDETYCEAESSISLLHNVDRLENIHRESNETSPSKRPLVEVDMNVVNGQDDDDIQPSMSLLHREPKLYKTVVDNVKRKIPELAEIVYKEPAARTKAEKRMLPGWSCEKCVDFFGELYKDNPEMLAKKINECSHHRGVHNPTDRPKTPPGFWNPRWEVPDNTDEFNRQNNVA